MPEYAAEQQKQFFSEFCESLITTLHYSTDVQTVQPGSVASV